MCSLRVLKCWKRRNIRWPPSGTHGITHSSGVWNEKRSYSCFINCYYYLDTSAALSLFMLRRTGWDLDSISFSWTLHQAQINERLPFLARSDIVTWGETESRNVVLSTEAGENCVSRALRMKVLLLYPCSSPPSISLQPSWTSRSITAH